MKRFGFILLSVIIVLSACSKNDDGDVSSPYAEHGIEYMGFRSGLNSSSSEAEFMAALNDVVNDYANNPDASTEIEFDGITYDLVNLQTVTGGLPTDIWDTFWEELEDYDADVGSCWGFSKAFIPARGEVGTVYVIYAIVTSYMMDEIYYVAVKGSVIPQ